MPSLHASTATGAVISARAMLFGISLSMPLWAAILAAVSALFG